MTDSSGLEGFEPFDPAQEPASNGGGRDGGLVPPLATFAPFRDTPIKLRDVAPM